MKGKILKLTAASVMMAGTLGIQNIQMANAAEGDFNLSIMHTNDTHANLENVAKRVTLVNQIRSENPNNLLLDAGDVFSGTLYFNTFQGQADLTFMNLMKYDAMTFGNHEFDLGSSAEGHSALAEFVGGADFPFVAANVNVGQDPYLSPLDNDVYTSEFENGQIFNGIVKEIDGERVGIFGLTTEETASISSPEAVQFTNYINAAEEAVAAFEAQGINKIIALTHIGYDDSALFDNDQLLAQAVAGIDVIVGGHTHTALTDPIEYNGHSEPTIIVQAGQYGANLGELNVTFDDDGAITSYAGQLHDVNAAAADPEASALLVPYAAEIEEVKNTETGAVAEVFLNGTRNEGGVRASETNLGNLITDGMLATAKTIDPETVIALQNGGGIRSSIEEGPITYGEVLTVMPFGNALAIMNITGAEIKTALERSVSQYPNESGGFLHVSGLKFTFDAKAAVGQKVQDVYVMTNENSKGKSDKSKFKKINDTQYYKVATNTFTAKGGDGYDVFGAAYADGRVSEPGNIDYEMFVDYIAELGQVNPQMENRITDISGMSKDCQKKLFTPAPDCKGGKGK